MHVTDLYWTSWGIFWERMKSESKWCQGMCRMTVGWYIQSTLKITFFANIDMKLDKVIQNGCYISFYIFLKFTIIVDELQKLSHHFGMTLIYDLYVWPWPLAGTRSTWVLHPALLRWTFEPSLKKILQFKEETWWRQKLDQLTRHRILWWGYSKNIVK